MNYREALDRASGNNIASYVGLSRASLVTGGFRKLWTDALVSAYNNKFCGVFIDEDGQPDWARFLARYEKDKFLSEAPLAKFEEHSGQIQGTGKGKRAIWFNFALKLDSRAFTGRQNTGNCFTAGTRIRMADGSDKSIEKLSLGDCVLTAEGNIGRVTKLFFRYCNDVPFISLLGTNGHYMFMTTEHPILTRRGYIPVAELLGDDLVARSVPNSLKLAFGKVLDKGEFYHNNEWVFNCEVEPDNSYVANGMGVHNCVAASWGWEGMNLIAGTQILALEKPFEWKSVYGTALIYACRGHSGQGMTMAGAANATNKYGTQIRDLYCNGKYDFREEDKDETYGANWGSSGPPSDLTAETILKPHRAVSSFSANADAVMDVLYNGGFIHTGSTITGESKGDPVSKATGVGAHAQTFIGYDDTDEFRQYYQQTTGKALTEAVVLIGQTWGIWNTVTNWPKHLWGAYPEGTFVLKMTDALRMAKSDAFAYGPDLEGWQPHKIEFVMG